MLNSARGRQNLRASSPPNQTRIPTPKLQIMARHSCMARRRKDPQVAIERSQETMVAPPTESQLKSHTVETSPSVVARPKTYDVRKKNAANANIWQAVHAQNWGRSGARRPRAISDSRGLTSSIKEPANPIPILGNASAYASKRADHAPEALKSGASNRRVSHPTSASSSSIRPNNLSFGTGIAGGVNPRR